MNTSESSRILCVNLNAAIDKTVIVQNFQIDHIHRPTEVLMLPGGKGCNVARVLKTLGAAPIVTGWIGGHSGQFIEMGLQAEDIDTAFIHTAHNSRTCLSVIDPENHTLTEIYEHGNPVEADAVAQLLEHYRALVARVAMVVLSGSVPPDVPRDIYAQLITIAHAAHVPTLLDSSGDTLELGLSASPTLVKPNQHELSHLLKRDLKAMDDYVEAARELYATYKCNVVVSLGAAGAIGLWQGDIWHAQAPTVTAVSAVGSGDALVAGLAYTLSNKGDFADALRLGIAAGTANTLQIGAGRVARDDIESLKSRVNLKRINEA